MRLWQMFKAHHKLQGHVSSSVSIIFLTDATSTRQRHLRTRWIYQALRLHGKRDGAVLHHIVDLALELAKVCEDAYSISALQETECSGRKLAGL